MKRLHSAANDAHTISWSMPADSTWISRTPLFPGNNPQAAPFSRLTNQSRIETLIHQASGEPNSVGRDTVRLSPPSITPTRERKENHDNRKSVALGCRRPPWNRCVAPGGRASHLGKLGGPAAQLGRRANREGVFAGQGGALSRFGVARLAAIVAMFHLPHEHFVSDRSAVELRRRAAAAVLGPVVRFHTRQLAGLGIIGFDCLSDSGQEVYNFCQQEGIKNLVLMGVHTNYCIVNRSFGIRQMVRVGMNVALARDLTDALYDPREPPFVSHARGTEIVVEHIERYLCPSILSVDLTHVVSGSDGPVVSK